MRTFVQRRLPFAVVGLGAVLAGRALAQSAPTPSVGTDNRPEAAAIDALVSKANETPEEAEEITVEGRRGSELGRYRLELLQARDGIVETFNKVNSNDANDVKCRSEKPTGSRMSHSVCRSKAQEDSDAAAAKGFLGALFRGSTSQEVAGSPQLVTGAVGAGAADSAGHAGETEARAKLEAEMKKMLAENRELYRAVVKYIEVRDDYNKAREKSEAAAAN